MKALLDPECTDLKDEFFDVFYAKFAPRIVDGLAAAKDVFTKSLLLDILAFCAGAHGTRVKYYVTYNNVFQRLAPLYSDPRKCVRLSMVRFFRIFFANNDEALNRYIIKHDLFAPLVKLMQSSRRDNLMASALLEIFNSAVTLNMRSIILYIMDKHKATVTEGPSTSQSVMRKIRDKHAAIMQERQAKRPADPPRPAQYYWHMCANFSGRRPANPQTTAGKPEKAVVVQVPEDGKSPSGEKREGQLAAKRVQPEMDSVQKAKEDSKAEAPGPAKKKKEEDKAEEGKPQLI